MGKGQAGRWKLLIFILVGLVVLLAAGALGLAGRQSPDNGVVVINGTEVPPVPSLDPQQVALGEQLYRQYCVNCHGANLEGAQDWKKSLADGSLPPPPHNNSGHTWHHPDSLLLNIILEGGEKLYGGTMPPFNDRLTRKDTESILDFFKSRWGKEEREYQWWMTVTDAR